MEDRIRARESGWNKEGEVEREKECCIEGEKIEFGRT